MSPHAGLNTPNAIPVLITLVHVALIVANLLHRMEAVEMSELRNWNVAGYLEKVFLCETMNNHKRLGKCDYCSTCYRCFKLPLSLVNRGRLNALNSDFFEIADRMDELACWLRDGLFTSFIPMATLTMTATMGRREGQ